MIPENLRRPINKPEHAIFHLDQLKAELEKPDVRLRAVEAYLSGCLGAVQSAFYALEKAHPRFRAVHGQWRRSLEPADREFMNRMMAERDNDVHLGRTTFHLCLTPQPIGAPPIPIEFRLNLGGRHPGEIAGACRRFIALMADLIRQFREE
jgi:hypothetical protein